MTKRHPALFVLAFGAILVLVYAITAATSSFATTQVAPDLQVIPVCGAGLNSDLPVDPATQCPNLVELNLTPNRVDPSGSQVLDLTVGVFPSGIYGGSVANGALATRSLLIQGDSVGENSWRIPSNTLTGGKVIAAPMIAKRAYSDFPFDSYTTSWTALVEDAVSAERVVTTGTVESTLIPGFDLNFSRLNMDADVTLANNLTVNERGRFSLDITVTRSKTTIIETGLLLLAVLVGAASAVYMTFRIQQGSRPPSLAALGWLATLLFALIEVRQSLPTNPPLGIRLDTLVFFPVMVLVTSLIAVVTFAWLRRPEWDVQNLSNNTIMEKL